MRNESSLKLTHASFFSSLRSCHISSCYEDKLIVEPYSPYRFSPQLGFYQVGTLWRICVHHGDRSKVFLPTFMSNPQNHVTARFRGWWVNKHGDYLEKNTYKLVDNTIPPPAQPKLLKRNGTNLGGKQLRLIEKQPSDAPS